MWQNISDLRSVQNEPLYFNISDLLPARMYSYRLYGVYEPLLGGTPHSAAGEATTFISASTYEESILKARCGQNLYYVVVCCDLNDLFVLHVSCP